MEARRAQGSRFALAEALAILVPLCVEAGKKHEAGDRFYLHPSSVSIDDPLAPKIDAAASAAMPTLPRDRACLAPEERGGAPGNARASVFALGAMLYEMVTGESVGPGMRRPKEVAPELPESLEIILGKALVSDAEHRPDDLNALASALHNMAPSASIAPPPADESHLDGDGEFEVDVRLSMLPPAVPRGLGAGDGFGVQVTAAPTPRANDPTSRLADLKARLESDPRPRYVVSDGGMDHGPFSAVELLQQIASNTFNEDAVLRDVFSNEFRAIKDWDEFAPFAEQARLHREIKAEKQELEKVITAEKKATTSKALIGGAVLGVLVVAGGLLALRSRGARDDSVDIEGDKAVAVDVDGGVKAGQKGGPGGPGGPGGKVSMGPGGIPILPGGMSCEQARERYVEEIKMNGGTPDLTQGQFAAVLNNGAYLNGCGVPESAEVGVCVAVQNGRAVGVTVSMKPPNPGAQSCVAGKVRGLSFPSNPKLDVARTTFAGK